MDMPRSEVRKLRFDEYSVTKHLEHASRQARERAQNAPSTPTETVASP